ncbi:MAG: T9SS type A sorting domain-containing protein [Ignavibacteria bacterium]
MKTFYTNTKIILLIVFALSLNSSDIFSQLNVGGAPISSLTQLSSNFQSVTMPVVDSRRLLEEDAATANIPDMPLRYGTIFDVNYNLENSGTWEIFADGSRIWRLAILSNDAMSLNLTYKNFFMPKGSVFFVYNPGKNFVFGGFTELNNSEDRQFATTPVPGNTTVLEYYEPSYSTGQGSITVSQVVHGYKDIMGFNNVLELPCNININCPIGGPWVDQKRSVTRITFNLGPSGFLCTGSLMNNTQNNRTPYYLTAEHCASDNYSTMVFYFNYESATCNGTTGPLSQTLTGATVKSENFATDFRLLLFNNPVPAAYNAYFNGWDKSGNNPTVETAIHHPGGVIKKISMDENPAVTSNGFGGRLPGGFWDVVWDQGVTEGGSSGCPMYDQNKRVIGQNLGGNPASCTNPQSVHKVFGKLSESWAFGGSSGTQLKDWLDPINSGVATLDGIDDLTGVAPVSNFTSNIQNLPIGGGSVDFYDLSTNSPTSWSWSFPGGTPSTSNVRNPTGITYSATGPYVVSLTTTNSFGSNLKTIIDYVTVAGVPLNTFTQQTPLNNSTILVSQTDPSIFRFIWSTSNPSNTVSYKFKIKKAGPGTEYTYRSDNNGLDTVSSFRKSFLDSLAVTMGVSGGDSATCSWRVSAFNGLDSITTSPIIVKIRRSPVGINQVSSIVPDNFKLYNNYPNPFNPNTIIKFDVSRSQQVVLKVYNLLGEVVSTLVNENLSAGSYNVQFNAGSISSGMYFYRLETDGFVATKRMVLVK